MLPGRSSIREFESPARLDRLRDAPVERDERVHHGRLDSTVPIEITGRVRRAAIG